MDEDGLRRLGEIERQVAEIRAELSEFSGPLPDAAWNLVPLLRKYRTSIESLERRLTALSEAPKGTQDGAAEIPPSRTRRRLIEIGGWLLRAARILIRPSKDRQATAYRVTRGRDVYWCDEPADGSCVFGDVVAVRGWFLSKHPVTSVTVALPGSRGVTASIGLLGPDAAAAQPEGGRAVRRGYDAQLPVAEAGEGPLSIDIVFLSGQRRLQTLRTRVRRETVNPAKSGPALWPASAGAEDRNPTGPAGASGPRPLVSILMPVYNPATEVLNCAVRSVLEQSYPAWELCIANDGSDQATRAAVEGLAARDSRIRVVHRESRGGIAAASNSCLDMAQGDIVTLLDQDDELSPDALHCIVDGAASHPSFTLIYSDEDKLTEDGRRFDPFFKPDWSPDLLRSMNYLGHLVAMPRTLVAALGGFSAGYEGSQDYDLVLRVSERPGQIVHIPSILYHWRATEGSVAKDHRAKPFAYQAGLRAVSDHLTRSGEAAVVEATPLPGRYQVKYSIPPGSSVSIVIASTGRLPALIKTLDSLADETQYPDFDIVVADNSRDGQVEYFVRHWIRRGRPARYLDWRSKPLNYSAINNAAARTCSAPFLLFLNDGIEVLSPDWLGAMLELAGRPVVGAVGAKLLYPDGRLYHAGITLGVFGCCANGFQGVAPAAAYFDFPDVVRNVAAVTGACLLTRSEVYWAVGGFDERRFPIAFNDVDLCLKIGAAGYRVLYTPRAVLCDHGAYSKHWQKLWPAGEEVDSLRERWGAAIERDPFYSPWLSRKRTDFSRGGTAEM